MEKWIGGTKSSLALLAILSIFVIILIPIPGGLINIMIAFSMAWAAVLLVRSTNIEDWDQLTTFPTILLLSTMFRIVLNITTTKKILLDGDAGSLIDSAGTFVVQGSLGIGVVMFLVLIIVQFVIANGASRIAEVAARFTLDSLPGKQMSIDSDMQQGLITQDIAKSKREKLDMEIDFYGNMDGAGKFIKGDVIIGICLTIVNVIAGFAVGMLVHNMDFASAAEHYTLLTIGDGVLNQLCSLMVSLSAGFLMTRVYKGDGKNATQGMISELTQKPEVMNVVAGSFILMGILTPLPIFPFLIIALPMFYIAYKQRKTTKEAENEERVRELAEKEQQAVKEAERVDVFTEVETITLEVGMALIPVVEEKQGESLKDKVNFMRKSIAREIGVVIPSINVLDNTSLMPYTKYNILIKGGIVASGELMVNRFLALKTPYTVKEVEGQETKDPIFGEEALWITEDKAKEAKDYGYTVLDPLNILSTHLNEVIRRNLHEFIQRQEVYHLMETVKDRHKGVINEIEKQEIPLSVIQGVIQNLLRENVSIRNLPEILEAIVDCKTHKKVEDINKIDNVTYIVREKLSKQICQTARNKDGKMYIILPSNDLETVETIEHHTGYYLNLDANKERELFEAVVKEVQKAQIGDVEPVILTQRPDLRFALSRMLQKYNLQVAVLSMNEIVPGVKIDHIGTIQFQKSEAV